MPLTALHFQPGINKDVTNYAGKGGWYACDKVRFRQGFAEKLGGWTTWSANNSTFNGIARNMFPWITTDSQTLIGLGTNQKYYIANGGSYYDITPVRAVQTLGASPFATVNGSQLITVTATSHGATVGSFVTFASAAAVAGLTLNGQFEIISSPDANTFTIIAPSAANATTTGGGTPTATFLLNAGNAIATPGSGWGVGGWGLGGWGSNTTVLPMTIWSQCNFFSDLIFAYRGGTIYYWAKDTVLYTAGVSMASYITTNAASTTLKVSKYTTASTAAGSNPTITVTDTFQIDAGAIVTGTNVAAGTYVASTWDGSVNVPLIGSITGGGVASSALLGFSYSPYAVPQQVSQIFTDPNAITIALGANGYNPTNFNTTYDPLLVRWSDQNNPYEWVPATYNQAGSNHLANGSYLVTGRSTRQENLIWTNSALYSMQYVGPPYIYSFNPLATNISIASPNAAITVNNISYWMGVDQFYIYSGSVQPLPCTLRDFVFENISVQQLDQVVCGVNNAFHEIWWSYPSPGSKSNDTYVVYNYLENVWYHGNLPRTAWQGSALFQPYTLGCTSIQVSYLNAAVGTTDTTIQLINSSSYPNYGYVYLDNELIYYSGNSINNNTLTGCIRAQNGTAAASHTIYTTVKPFMPNQILNHESGYDDYSGPFAMPMLSYVQSSDMDIGDGHNFSFIWRIIPDITFANTAAGNTNPVYLAINPRNNSGSQYLTGPDTLTYSTTQQNTYSPTVAATTGASGVPKVAVSSVQTQPPKIYPVEQYTGEVFTRVRGRQFNLQVYSTGLGTAWRMGNMRIDVRSDGRR
jgi:hypothetical protein